MPRLIFFIIPFFISCQSVRSDNVQQSGQAVEKSDAAIDQLGFLPGEEKYFIINACRAAGGDVFVIKDAYGSNVYQGIIGSNVVDDTPSSGDKVLVADFSSFNQSGSYEIYRGSKFLCPLVIDTDVYRNLFKDSLRCFYIIRANSPINDPVSGIFHSASHMSDANLSGRDFTGGWYNAGDYGKWTHEASLSSAFMMWLYLLKKNRMSGLNIRIPESGNGAPDILNEARWGLSWLLKMQNTDGSVYHKVDTEPNFAWGLAPDCDTNTRYVSYQRRGDPNASTIDAADFTGVMSLAFFAFRDIDPPFAAACSNAAVRTWQWLVMNTGTAQNDPYYTDTDVRQELLWASGEICRLTGMDEARLMFERYRTPSWVNYPLWMFTDLFGYLALYSSDKTSPDLKRRLLNDITAAADFYSSISDRMGYMVALQSNEYFWGSNANAAGRGILSLIAYHFTGKERYKKTALRQLHYVLGANPLHFSYVTGYGYRHTEYPYHWTYRVYKKALKGWISGGADSNPAGADEPLKKLQRSGTPPAKCFIDMAQDDGSWASNEGATDMESSLMFLCGYFY